MQDICIDNRVSVHITVTGILFMLWFDVQLKTVFGSRGVVHIQLTGPLADLEGEKEGPRERRQGWRVALALSSGEDKQ